ncbi:two-component system, OmpR family, phosphate regulon response regulator PhoB/two-component system, OmpR family, alkaline phosphatase synthesis response regulator PhoP [Mucilaginibacter lappiensis]|nr:two-component system, OmpR family, phosphate regulon response regulator PhoB/two-component system, OmpR family, alkaline phosphatase synthesis response regulator PhoP [Mucilaginibacter lappiensis]
MIKKIMAKKILIVDHNGLMTEVMSYILISNGYEVMTLDNAAQIFSSIRQNQPDLIILDAVLPGIDGIDVCRLLKWNKETQTLPVIICTDNDDTENYLKQEGAPNDVLHKPFGMNNLIETVEHQLAA